MRFLLLVFLAVLAGECLHTQTVTSSAKSKKGSFYAYWGWNRAIYSNSDITFKGAGYDFVLEAVRAKDKPKDFSIDNYFNPLRMTIPQNNFRLGYYLTDKFSVSFSIDHMKYVVIQDQWANISGEIAEGSLYDGTYDNDPVKLDKDFLQFEHTDGLNTFNFEARRHKLLWKKWIIELNGLAGVSAGFIVPRTNTQLLGSPRYDKFHLSGYTATLTTGINIQLGNSFFIQSEYKGGFVNMPDIRTRISRVDRAKQHFFYAQGNLVLGAHFRLWK